MLTTSAPEKSIRKQLEEYRYSTDLIRSLNYDSGSKKKRGKLSPGEGSFPSAKWLEIIDRKRRLRARVMDLPDLEKEVLLIKYFNTPSNYKELSYQAIATKMGLASRHIAHKIARDAIRSLEKLND